MTPFARQKIELSGALPASHRHSWAKYLEVLVIVDTYRWSAVYVFGKLAQMGPLWQSQQTSPSYFSSCQSIEGREEVRVDSFL
jgi:hypothetical protein